MRHHTLHLLLLGWVLAHLTHFGKLLAWSLRWHRVLSRVHRIVLRLLYGDHLNIRCDTLAQLVIRPFGIDSTHLARLLRTWWASTRSTTSTDHDRTNRLAAQIILILLRSLTTVLVDNFGSIASHDQCLIHILLAGHAIIHGICMLFSQGLACRLLHMLLHKLLLVEFGTAGPTARLVNRLAPKATDVLDRLMTTRLLVRSLLWLLL